METFVVDGVDDVDDVDDVVVGAADNVLDNVVNGVVVKHKKKE